MSNYLTRTWYEAESLADQVGSAEAYGFSHAYRIAIDVFGTGTRDVSPEDILTGVLAIRPDEKCLPYDTQESLAFVAGFHQALPPLVDHLRMYGRI